jgi:prefoldin subunit 5
MEAATPLFATVRIVGDRLRVDGLAIDDECVVRLATERIDAGEDPAKLVRDAVEIGARVLDREHAGANAEFVKAEFERAARDLDAQFVERARRVADRLDTKMDEAFGADQGHVARALERHFGDASAEAVQHKVRLVVSEVATKMREDLQRQFSSDSDNNPLAVFQRMAVGAMRDGAQRQAEQLRAMEGQLGAMREQLVRLQAERAKLEELEAERERGTAKGRTFEEAVFEAIERLASVRGDTCEAVGDALGATGKKGDVVVGIDACAGPPRGRIVFEAKDAKSLSRNAALSYLDASRDGRDADYAVLVVPPDRLPARTWPLREVNGDKLFVTFDPEDEPLALEVAYGLARARVLMRRGEAGGLDADALRAEVERTQQAMEDVRRVKSQLTGATNSIEQARAILDTMAAGVRGHLGQIDALLDAAEA